jgi:hypothetical protein
MIYTKINRLIEEATGSFLQEEILRHLRKLLKTRYQWELKDDIKQKFLDRFTNFKKKDQKYIGFDKRKNRQVILDPDNKSFVIVLETKRPCGFLNGAVRASKNKYQL